MYYTRILKIQADIDRCAGRRKKIQSRLILQHHGQRYGLINAQHI